jgi:hypothetical protein
VPGTKDLNDHVIIGLDHQTIAGLQGAKPGDLDAARGDSPESSASPTIKFLLKGGPIERPVSAIHVLAKRGGLSLKEARSVVEQLAVGNPILMVELQTDAPHALAFDLARLGIHAVFFKSLDDVFGALRLCEPSLPRASIRSYQTAGRGQRLSCGRAVGRDRDALHAGCGRRDGRRRPAWTARHHRERQRS